MRITKKQLFSILIILLYFGLVYFVLRVYNIDYTKIKDVDLNLIREKVAELGILAPIIYIVLFLLRPLILFPSTILAILGGVIFGYFWGIIWVLLGAMLSAVTEFFLSRYCCRKLVMDLIHNSNLIRLSTIIEKRGFITVFLIRLIPNVAFDIQNFGLGLSKVKFSDYFFATLLGIIPINLIYVYLGYSILDFSNFWKAVCILLGLLIIYLYVNRLMKSNKIRVINEEKRIKGI